MHTGLDNYDFNKTALYTKQNKNLSINNSLFTPGLNLSKHNR